MVIIEHTLQAAVLTLTHEQNILAEKRAPKWPNNGIVLYHSFCALSLPPSFALSTPPFLYPALDPSFSRTHFLSALLIFLSISFSSHYVRLDECTWLEKCERRSCAVAQRSALLEEHHSCQFIFNTYIISVALDSDAFIAGEKLLSCAPSKMARKNEFKIRILHSARAIGDGCTSVVVYSVRNVCTVNVAMMREVEVSDHDNNLFTASNSVHHSKRSL